MITTKRPSDDMIEVAIVSLQEALRADGQAIPARSADYPRVPLADVEAQASVDAAVGPESAEGLDAAEEIPVAARAAPAGAAIPAEAPVAVGEAGPPR
jgi:hypothetical protein